jgi:aspartate dehydrogenase
MGGTGPVAPTYCVVFARRIESECTGPRGRPEGQGKGVAREPLKVGLAGLGAVGLNVARRIEAGIPGLVLTAVSARDVEKARRNLPQAGIGFPVLPVEKLAEACDVVVECLPPSLFRNVALPAVERGRILVPLSVGQLLENWNLVTRAKETGARILVPTGALLGLDAVRAAAEGTIRSVTMITRKPPGGLDGALYLVQRGISVKNLHEPLKVFDGTAREGARGFPENVNVAAALSLAGIGPDRTRLEIWADPAINRNTHRIEVDADTASFSMAIENVPSENPKTGRIVALSTVAALRGLVADLKVGT